MLNGLVRKLVWTMNTREGDSRQTNKKKRGQRETAFLEGAIAPAGARDSIVVPHRDKKSYKGAALIEQWHLKNLWQGRVSRANVKEK